MGLGYVGLILVPGIAYKRDIDDVRESSALDVITVLQQWGAMVDYVDPHVPSLDSADWHSSGPISAVETLDAPTLHSYDCVVIVTDHSAFDYPFIAQHASLVVDARNAIKEGAPHVFRLGAPAFTAPAAETTMAVTSARPQPRAAPSGIARHSVEDRRRGTSAVRHNQRPVFSCRWAKRARPHIARLAGLVTASNYNAFQSLTSRRQVSRSLGGASLFWGFFGWQGLRRRDIYYLDSRQKSSIWQTS